MVIKERKYLTIEDAIKIRRETQSDEEFEERLRNLKARGAGQPIERPQGGIGIREAGRKYRISGKTISRWVSRGLIPVIMETPTVKYIDAKTMSEIAIRYKSDSGRGKRTVVN